MLCVVDDEVCFVGEGRYVGYDVFGGYVFDGLDGVGGVGVGGYVVV